MRPAAYVVVGLVLWVAMLKAGVEAALAGVLIALAVPLRAPGCRCSSPVRDTERYAAWVPRVVPRWRANLGYEA